MEEILQLISFTNTKFDIVFYCLFSLLPFAILGFLFSKSLEREPSFLIGIDRMKGMKNAWTLLLVLTAPLVFIYNTFVWAGWAFVVVAEFIANILNKVYHFLFVHIINALKWVYTTLKIEFWWKVPKWVFMNIIWMPVVFTAKFIFHYTIRWGWDLYLTSFQSIKGTYNYNKLKVGFKGAFYTLLILGISIYLAELFEQETIAFVGLLLSVLPTLHSVGTITSMNHFEEERDHASHGNKVMKASLSYIITTLIAIITIHALLFFSIIPDIGLTVLGIAINTNVFLSGVTLLCLLVLSFSISIFPNHLLKNDESNSFKESIVSYLKIIKDKGVQLIAITIPAGLWATIVALIPAVFVYYSIATADSFKTNFYEEENKKATEELSEVGDELSNTSISYLSDSTDIITLEEAYEDLINAELYVNQTAFATNFPNNVIENTKLIFDDNHTSLTTTLPGIIDDLKNNITKVTENIKLLENEKLELETYFKQFENEKWQFIVQRRDGDSSDDDDWKTISKSSDISKYIDEDVIEGEKYQYRVKVKNRKGSSKWSPIISKTISNHFLSSPTGLIVRGELNFKNVLFWNDNSYNENKFVIERKLSKEKEWSVIGEVESDINKFTDSNIKTNESYDYRVFATGMGEKSKPTNTAQRNSNLSSPSFSNTKANLESTLLDWKYNFRYNKITSPKKRITPNGTDGSYINNESSFYAQLKSEIENLSAKITSKNKELTSKQELLVMYNSLVDYDKAQQKILLVFKNTAFIFAILFVALFGGLICSILFSYFAKLFYNAYTMKEEDEWYFITLTNEAKAENNNQPLLGFTLLFILILIFSGSLSIIM